MSIRIPSLRLRVLLVVVGLILPVALNGTLPNSSADDATLQSVPIVTSAEVSGKALLVHGANFSPGAQIFINGEPQKTRYDSFVKLTGKKAGKKIKTGDIIQVRNPDGSTSAEFLFNIVPYAVPLTANDIVYSPSSNRLYASVASISKQFPDAIAVIDPRSAQVENTVRTWKEPRVLALSDDNRFLYVICNDLKVQRVDLNTFRIDLEFTADVGFGPEACPFLTDVQAMPGHPGTIAVAVSASCTASSAIAIFDNGIRRPVVSPRDFLARANMIRFGSSPDTLWGYNSFSSSFALIKFTVGAQGVIAAGKPAEGLLFGFNQRIEFTNGLLYTTNGRAVDPENLTLDGRFLARETITARASVVDAGAGRVYFAQREGFEVTFLGFDLKTYRLTEFYRSHYGLFGDIENHMVRCGPSGLALIVPPPDGKIAIFPLPLLRPVSSYQPPAPQPINGGVRRIPLPNYSLAYDASRQLFYASVPGIVAGFGNSVVPINPLSGSVGDPVWVGSEPWQMAVTDNGQYLYTALFGGRGIRRVRLPDLVPDLRFPLFSEPRLFSEAMSTTASEILTLPGEPESLIVARWGDHNHDVFDPDGVGIYDNGVKRPDSTPSWPSGPPTNTIQLSTSGTKLFALNTQISNFTFTTMGLDSNGIRILASTDGVGDSSVTAMKCQSGLCFTNTGLIIDPETQTRLGRFKLDSAEPLASIADYVVPDVPNGRVYFILSLQTGIYIKGCDLNSRAEIESFKVPDVSGPIAGFWLWGNDQFAFSTGDEVVLLPKSLLRPIPR